MQSRILVGGLLLAVVAAAGTFAPPIVQANPAVKWAAVYLPEPTRIADSLAQGNVIFEHDDGRMARGEPCTVVYQFLPGKGPGKAIAAFHCKPLWGDAIGKFSLTTERDYNGTCVLRAYQFAGDIESHGVPRTK